MVRQKFVLPLLLCMLFCEVLQACEFHNFFGGTNPLYTRNVIGMRYRLRNVLFHHDEAMQALGGEEHTGGTLSYAECWGRLYLSKKTIAWINLPIFFNPGQNTWLGDPSLLIQRQLLTVMRDSTLSMRWFAGTGVKLPSPIQKTIDADAQFITSTGSFDFLFNTSFILNYKKTGFTLDASYKLNTPNRAGLQCGNVINANIAGFYSLLLGKTRLICNASAFCEQAGNHINKGEMEAGSHYTNLYTGLGVDLFYRNFSVGAGVQRMVFSSVEGIHEWRAMAGLAFSFGR